eukprot:SAG31_NODE_3886_length_3784_cov_1.800543_1_plen_120_part_00
MTSPSSTPHFASQTDIICCTANSGVVICGSVPLVSKHRHLSAAGYLLRQLWLAAAIALDMHSGSVHLLPSLAVANQTCTHEMESALGCSPGDNVAREVQRLVSKRQTIVVLGASLTPAG